MQKLFTLTEEPNKVEVRALQIKDFKLKMCKVKSSFGENITDVLLEKGKKG